MTVPYRIYTKIPKEEIIRTVETRCTGDIKYTIQMSERHNEYGCYKRETNPIWISFNVRLLHRKVCYLLS